MMFGNGTTRFCPWCGASYSTTDTLLLVAFGLLVLAGVTVLIIWLVRSMGAPHDKVTPMPGAHDDAALRVARERFARGEITREQYEDIVATLRG